MKGKEKTEGKEREGKGIKKNKVLNQQLLFYSNDVLLFLKIIFAYT